MKKFRDAFIFAIEHTGRSVREVAATAGVPYDQLKSLFQGKSQTTNADTAVKIAHAFGVTYDEFIAGNLSGDSSQPTVAIAGSVGAGARVPVFDAYEKGDGPQVECPPGLSPHGIVAVEVTGDSMEPIYSDGDLLFYTRHTHEGVPAEAIGKRCVCEDADGMGWVKLVKRGTEPGKFHLVALNPEADNQHDVVLKWAAPVLLHWPAALVKRA